MARKRKDQKQGTQDDPQKRQPPAHPGGGTLSGDSGSFGEARGDAGIDRDLGEVEREDDSLLAGGRRDVEKVEGGRAGGGYTEGTETGQRESGEPGPPRARPPRR